MLLPQRDGFGDESVVLVHEPAQKERNSAKLVLVNMQRSCVSVLGRVPISFFLHFVSLLVCVMLVLVEIHIVQLWWMYG